jgi:hypothetical protein
MQRTVTKLSIAGAICYVLWGCLHLDSGYSVYLLGTSVPSSMVQGRVLQDAWNLFFFGVAAIAVALTLNIRNNPWGYWINLGITALADTGLIFFVLVPGYLGLWPGLAGPILWVLGFAFTTAAYIQRNSDTAISHASRT